MREKRLNGFAGSFVPTKAAFFEPIFRAFVPIPHFFVAQDFEQWSIVILSRIKQCNYDVPRKETHVWWVPALAAGFPMFIIMSVNEIP